MFRSANQTSQFKLQIRGQRYKRALNLFEKRLREVVDRFSQFVSAIKDLYRCPELMKIMMFCLANSSDACRERLVSLLSHPSVIPLSVQYIPGLQTWTCDQFNGLSGLTDCGTKRFVTTYIGLAPMETNTYVYVGSATATTTRNGRPGKARGMVLQRGKAEILRRLEGGYGMPKINACLLKITVSRLLTACKSSCERGKAFRGIIIMKTKVYDKSVLMKQT